MALKFFRFKYLILALNTQIQLCFFGTIAIPVHVQIGPICFLAKLLPCCVTLAALCVSCCGPFTVLGLISLLSIYYIHYWLTSEIGLWVDWVLFAWRPTHVYVHPMCVYMCHWHTLNKLEFCTGGLRICCNIWSTLT